MEWVLLLLPALVEPAGGADPAAAFAAAAADVARLPVDARGRIRYLTLMHLPPAERLQAIQALAGHVQGLSRESDLVPPAIVPGTALGLLRIDLDDYGWARDLWEQLAEADPYFQVKVTSEVVVRDVERVWAGGKWPGDGKVYAAGAFRYQDKERKATTVTALAPWAGDQASRAALVLATTSKAPIVRGDWFLYQTAAQVDRKPGYYDFLGIKDRATFEALIGFNAKLVADARRKELLEAVADSRVSQQPRRIGAFNTVGGLKYWRTFDSKAAIDKKNPLRVLDGAFEHDAEESFGPLPNNFWAWGLFDDKGKRQDSAPDFIGPDRTSSTNDGRIHVGLSCIRCHYDARMGSSAGLQNVDAWARGLFTGTLRLQSPDYNVLKDLRQKYLRDLEGPIKDDRQAHGRAVKEATGLEADAWAKIYSQTYAAYEAPVTLDRAARELGLGARELGDRLQSYLQRTGSLDPVLAALMRGQRIPVRQYEEAFPLLMLSAKGLVP